VPGRSDRNALGRTATDPETSPEAARRAVRALDERASGRDRRKRPERIARGENGAAAVVAVELL
jgi:hypothetical protein